MGILIMFGFGRLIYVAIGRREKWFLLAEAVSLLVFVSIGILLFKIGHDSVRGTLLGFVFVLTGLGSKLIIPHHPIEAGGEKVKDREEIVPVGIIDFVWLCIMGGTLAFIGFAAGVSPFNDPVPSKGLSADYYAEALNTTVFLLDKTLDSFFCLGAILAGCMAILWSGAIWRKSDEIGRFYYRRTTLAAIKMVVGFFVVALNTLIWIGVPLYNRMTMLVKLLE